MSFNFNNCTFIGRATADPKVTRTAEMVRAAIHIAVDRPFKKKDGTHDVDFIPVVFFGKTAEAVEKTVKKGMPILATGRIQNRTWEKEGVKQNITELMAESWQIMESNYRPAAAQ